MPNWVGNRLYVQGAAKTRRAFRLAARGVYTPPEKSKKPKKVALQFASFLPHPPIEDLNKIYANELDPDWPVEMLWQTDNWGCKWDLWDNVKLIQTTNSSLVYAFLTAWSPPYKFVRRVSSMYDLAFSLHSYTQSGRIISKYAGGYGDGHPDYKAAYNRVRRLSRKT